MYSWATAMCGEGMYLSPGLMMTMPSPNEPESKATLLYIIIETTFCEVRRAAQQNCDLLCKQRSLRRSFSILLKIIQQYQARNRVYFRKGL
jgi:hypothetical protein